MTLNDWIEMIVAAPGDRHEGLALLADWLEERDDVRHRRLRWWLAADRHMSTLPAVRTNELCDYRSSTAYLMFDGQPHGVVDHFVSAALYVMPQHRLMRSALTPERRIDCLGELRFGHFHAGHFLVRNMLLRCGLHAGREFKPQVAFVEESGERIVLQLRAMQEISGPLSYDPSEDDNLWCLAARQLVYAASPNGSARNRVRRLQRAVAAVNGYDVDNVTCRCSRAASAWLEEAFISCPGREDLIETLY